LVQSGHDQRMKNKHLAVSPVVGIIEGLQQDWLFMESTHV